MGAIKQPGRMVQGVTSAITGTDYPVVTDAAFGLPKGASAEVMQPHSVAEKVGGYAADAAELAAGGAADAGVVGSRFGVQSANVAQRVGIKGAEVAADVSQGAVQAAKAALLGGGGPVTATKIGAAVTKYGLKAVEVAMGYAGLGASIEAWKYLTSK